MGGRAEPLLATLEAGGQRAHERRIGAMIDGRTRSAADLHNQPIAVRASNAHRSEIFAMHGDQRANRWTMCRRDLHTRPTVQIEMLPM